MLYNILAFLEDDLTSTDFSMISLYYLAIEDQFWVHEGGFVLVFKVEMMRFFDRF
jgi:hypothetical protein